MFSALKKSIQHAVESLGVAFFVLLCSLVEAHAASTGVLVNLDARDPSAGTTTWDSTGTLGNFSRVGTPTLINANGQPAVVFNGTSDAYRSIAVTTSAIEAAAARSIEVWALNPVVDTNEETMVAWGHRGTTRGDMAFNYGNSATYGAVTHYAGDMGWSGNVPAAGQWHHLVYTYDGTTARVYDNTVLRTSATFSGGTALATGAGFHLNVGAQNAATAGGPLLFVNEFDSTQLAFSGYVALVRVHSGALTTGEISASFDKDAARFGATVHVTPTPTPTPFPLLSQGTISIDTPDFNLQLVRSSQTVAALQPKVAEAGFDFTPADRLSSRTGNSFNHLGDIDMRLRTGTSGVWTSYSSSAFRQPVIAQTTNSQILASADLSPSFPSNMPVNVKRSWELEDGKLVVRFVITNPSTTTQVQIGSLGIPMIFNNYITGRTLTQAHEICSFDDPNIGLDGGYVQVTRLKGVGPALLVVLENKTTPFEAWNNLNSDATARSQTFEGFYEWMANSQAYAENEWATVSPWNNATLRTLDPGTSTTYALKLLVAPEIRQIDATLEANNRPVAIGVPGYVLPQDLKARLFVKYASDVTSITCEPAGAITFHSDDPTTNSWQAFTVQGQTWGRARLTLHYASGEQQSINYDVIKPMSQAVSDLGNFLYTNQYYTNTSDFFGRGPSVITYDHDLMQPVLQDTRSWVAGLSDEAGAGSWLAAAMKNFGEPDAAEVAKFEDFVDGVLWGRLQYSTNISATKPMYSVARSLFYYQAGNGFPYTISSGWTMSDALDVWRAYNYAHVAAANWAMYRIARNNPGLVTHHPWDWYLDHAWHAGVVMLTNSHVSYRNVGLMEGSIFVQILKDLKREGMTSEAATYEAAFKPRADVWSTTDYPFGSEMAWDSTGQEEVYEWCKYYGYEDKATQTLNSIIGYMPTVPGWAYNGNARRYWDFQYAGKTQRLERQIHHYESGLSAIPVLDEYRQHPDDFYLLRVGYGGIMGSLSNIGQDGFASLAMHAWPNTLRWDALSGDYGPNFYGHAMNIATYIVNHPDYGWISFGGNLSQVGNWVNVTPQDSFRKRVYVAPFGVWVTLDAGQLQDVQVNLFTHQIKIGMSHSDQYTPQARVVVEQPMVDSNYGLFAPLEPLSSERGAYSVPLDSSNETWITLTDQPGITRAKWPLDVKD